MAEELNDGGRVAYLEARVGELHNTIGELRVGWRDADQAHARDVYLLLWLHAEAVWCLKKHEAADLEDHRVAYLEARVGELNNTIGELRASIADIDAHATPVGLLHNDDPEGSPHHYLLTVGALHRALGKAYTAEPCEAERKRLRVEVERLRREVEFEALGADTFSDADRIHSEAREESEEGSGRVDTGQAGREEAAEQTVGTGYPQGSGPGHGSATPAPLSSRPHCAVHPDGSDGVTQTILAGDASGRLGNCLQAAVATLLDLPLEQVPHFAESEGDWVADMVAFALAHGYRLTWRSKDEPPVFGLVFGPTVRSTELHHAVAIIGGGVWDPHPSRAGLTAESTFIDWVPVEGSVHPDGETA